MSIREAWDAVLRLMLRRTLREQDERLARSRRVADMMAAASRREFAQTDKLRRSGQAADRRLSR